MTRFPKELTENGIHYTLHGDYYFPDLTTFINALRKSYWTN